MLLFSDHRNDLFRRGLLVRFVTVATSSAVLDGVTVVLDVVTMAATVIWRCKGGGGTNGAPNVASNSG